MGRRDKENPEFEDIASHTGLLLGFYVRLGGICVCFNIVYCIGGLDLYTYI